MAIYTFLFNSRYTCYQPQIDIEINLAKKNVFL